ncbi:hypothetical protein RM844_10210 [Streptomyces sp. DSM 44915]|uniref:Uncharacterized protein n=1 Tax=Streptomyces chisholmiae TaxID=3075540 RepID=A0ABU2JNU4_9ACTN|nr:hypothetical protein [Streptomyces sp. DSM 44915]MDT0266665.1 hypothetical protein [Streptomyces sp. DSM 44915]
MSGARPPVRRRRRRLGLAALAGWLFADLLLVLALVSMSGQPDPLAAADPAVPEESATESPEPEPEPTEDEGPRGVERDPVEFGVSGGDAGELVEQLAAATERWAGREAAFVLTFGGGQGGTRYAGEVNALLHRARPDMFAEGITREDFHDLGEPGNTARLWVYFYTAPR